MQLLARIASRLVLASSAALLGLGLALAPAHAAEQSKRAVAKKPAKAVVAKRAQAKPAPRHARKVVHTKTARRVVVTHRSKSVARGAKTPVHTAAAAVQVPEKLSFGHMAGLNKVSDPLDLASSVALVIDQDTKEVLLRKNDQAVVPIASLTKLMTGLLISQAHLPMDEKITITQADVDTEKHSSSRLAVGTTLTRMELLHLALMSSENRAAHALGRTYPGGLDVFVQHMNDKAKLLGMSDTHYVEPTGLSSRNQSSAHDLATLVNVAHGDPLLRQLTTSPSYEVEVGRHTLEYRNTNRLVKSPDWDIGLQKTGYITEAGRCLVMQTEVAGRNLIMVFLDSVGKFSRLGDAKRVRDWVETLPAVHGIRAAQS